MFTAREMRERPMKAVSVAVERFMGERWQIACLGSFACLYGLGIEKNPPHRLDVEGA